VQESDRIRAIVDNLRQHRGRGRRVRRRAAAARQTASCAAGTIDSRGDHRIAMSFAVAGLIAEGETRIEGAEAASVSLPEFYRSARLGSGRRSGSWSNHRDREI
jgi:3-phosphoshikimate 1-carboxyvinyltransferase